MVSFIAGIVYPQPRPLSTSLEECCICLEEYDKWDPNKVPVTIRCGHVFHKKCLLEWEKKDQLSTEQYSCPLCRMGYRARQQSSFENLIRGVFNLCCCSGTTSHRNYI